MEKNYNLFMDGVRFQVHEVISPDKEIDRNYEALCESFKKSLLSDKITKDIRERYVNAIKDFPKYKHCLEAENTIHDKARRFMSLVFSAPIQDVLNPMLDSFEAENLSQKTQAMFTVAFFEVVLRDIEVIQGDGETYSSFYNHDLDCGCASFLRLYYPDFFSIGDYFARYVLWQHISPLMVFRQIDKESL
ncbi:MAG: hypothetical protein ABF876_07585 [Acetobacter aceti]|uniref:Uncharacterized protein n=1 Tax=Acetobacter aceti TaxID=435 RepID=A0A1U9KDV1_ACEAC|nr:hypothetical protein [Acetobacter aceti]AQS83962.1 hypothetical protein A0U92_03380 [Acetobacter aceti]